MTDKLVTAVGNVIDRILIMEQLAVPDADTATKAWMYINPVLPYWVNRPSGLTFARPDRWTLTIEARLILAHIGAVNKDDADGNTPQENAWEYIPAALRYFDQYNQLQPPTYAAIQYLAPDPVTIACVGGLRDLFNPYTGVSQIYISFDLTVPFRIVE